MKSGQRADATDAADAVYPADAIDTRWVFRAYAVLVGGGGFILFGWGPMWLGVHLAGQPWGKAALIRVAGALVMAAGCCAAGFASVERPADRRRGLLWFAAGHAVVWVVVALQRLAIWGPGLAETAGEVLTVVVFVLFYLWVTADGDPRIWPLASLGLGGGEGADSKEPLRSQYERQIREVARQEERNRLARDLHDSVKQQIFVIQTAAATAQVRFDGDQPGAREALEQVRGSAREAMTEMQAMLDQLRAVPLENTGLVEALKKQCEALGFRTGARVEFKLGNYPPAGALQPGAHEAILRVAQEALANVGRHARAGIVTVSLGSGLRYVEVRIEDDGSGFDPNHSSPGQGIANMRARAEEFGGKFELISRPGHGTSVAVSIPYSRLETAREYRNKAAAWGAYLVVSTGLLVFTKAWSNPLFVALAALGTVRNLLAYHRARARAEDAR